MTQSGNGGTLRAAAIDGDMLSCWLCQRPVAPVALYCHHCGAIQSPRDLDHFARFGLERRFDIDLDQLQRHYDRLHRTLDPMRFIAKGIGERANAQRHSEAITQAYETLRDPIRRARYLLGLIGVAAASENDPRVRGGDGGLEAHGGAGETIDLAALRTALGRAAEPVAIDRVANQATREIETCIRDLATAFRSDQLAAAAAALIRLERLEEIAADARALRAGL